MTIAVFFAYSRNNREQAGDVIEFEALVSTDGQPFVVVFPWGEDEQLASGTGLHSLAVGLCQVGKSVLLQVDEWESLFECGPHDGFLSRRYGGGNEYGSMSGSCYEVCYFRLDFCLSEAARHLHLQAHGAVEQEAVADGREGHSGGLDVALDTEQVGVLMFHQQAAGVVIEVMNPGFQLAFTQQQFVVIATGKQHAAGAVLVAAVFLELCLLR